LDSANIARFGDPGASPANVALAGIGRYLQCVRASRPRGVWIAAGIALAAAIGGDYFAPRPYVMTPLYAIPPLVAAYGLNPRQVVGTSIIAMAVNVTSCVIQHVPFSIGLLYSLGLVVTLYAIVLFTYSRHRARLHAEMAQQHLDEAEATKDSLHRFMSMVAHDLRTPLTVQLAYLERLRRTGDRIGRTELQEALEALHHSANQLARLAGDLSDTAEIGAGAFTVYPVPMDLVALLRAIAVTWEASAPQRLAVHAPAVIDGEWDPDRLGQVVSNLVSNAIKYGHTGRVDVTASASIDEATITVTDRGAGIPAEDLVSLFEPFVRLASATTTSVAGSGLGLFIAKRIVEAHGGRIWVESAVGVGTSVHVALPRIAPIHGSPARRTRAVRQAQCLLQIFLSPQQDNPALSVE